MKPASLTQLTPNTMQLAGQMDFASVADLQKKGTSWLKPIDTIDLSRVSHCNSAGLALLLEWQAAVRKQQRYLVYSNLPQTLLMAAEVYGIKDILQQV